MSGENAMVVEVYNGTCSKLKAGFAGDDEPKFVLSSIVGRPLERHLKSHTFHILSSNAFFLF